ncbi:hypothetical protein IFM89_013869 [Coptis chinensis]|uniref:Uncharacterized protein n=1 Tax=Coptis chinensis TaxID=261450 RepID=A0A835HBF9_9MAGN|nr:hypothetical protein IFM89_013869 [Coptis chinensis]
MEVDFDNDELSESLGPTKGVEHVESAPTSLRSNCNVQDVLKAVKNNGTSTTQQPCGLTPETEVGSS